MTQGKASYEEAEQSIIALQEIMKGMPKKYLFGFVGHFNDLFLFLDSVKKVLPKEEK